MKLNLNKLIKKEILVTSAVVLFLTLIFIGFTRAIYRTTSEGETNNIVYGNLEIQMCIDTSCADVASNLGQIVGMTDNITLTANIYPKTESEAILGTPYSFLVKNVSNYDTYVDLISEYDWASENPGSSLVTNYSGVMIAYKKAEDANYEIKELNQFTKSTELFKNIVFASGESQIFHVWIWGSEEVSNEIINKIFITKIKTIGYYLPEDVNNLHNDSDNSLVNEEANYIDFAYTGNFQEFIVPRAGTYKIELWGAQGGASTAGKGAYTSGKIYLTKGTKLYVYVGQSSPGANSTSFNGGTGSAGGVPGGGATDVRLTAGNWDDPYSLNSRIMVAAGSGAGSGNTAITMGSAGGIIGYNGNSTCSYDATYLGYGSNQTEFYLASIFPDPKFGIGGGKCGGGGGYYGGTGGMCSCGGGGGSSYISGHSGCIAINAGNDINDQRIIKNGCNASSTSKSCSVHYSGYSFNSTTMIDGAGYSWTTVKASTEGTMPSPAGGTEVGHAGNGYARITSIEDYVLDNSLIAHWDGIDNTLNGHSDSTDTWYDLSGNNNNALLYGSANSNWTSNGLELDGVDDYVMINNPSYSVLPSAHEFTLEYVLTVRPTTGTYFATCGLNHLHWIINQNKVFRSVNRNSNNDANNYPVSSVMSFQDNTTHTFSETYTSNFDNTFDVKYYYDGTKLTNTFPTTSGIATRAYFKLGISYDSTEYYKGNLKSVRIYNRALTENEIKQNHIKDSTRFIDS